MWRRRLGSSPGGSSWVLAASGLLLVAVTVWGLAHWWHLRAEEAAAKEATLPACIARLAGEPTGTPQRAEADCRELIAKNASDCMVVARHVKGRYEGGGAIFVQSEFDDCVVRGLSAILAENRESKERQARERRAAPP